MPRIDISRLDLQVHGLDRTLVRAALDQLPSHLGAALRQPAAAVAADGAPLRVPAGADAQAVASALAQRIAAVVRQRRAAAIAAPAPAVRRGGDGG
jgi:hypothetical protein